MKFPLVETHPFTLKRAETFSNTHFLKHLTRTGFMSSSEDKLAPLRSLKIVLYVLTWGVFVYYCDLFFSSPGLTVHPSLCLHVLPEYLEVVWRSLASENTECPLLVKKASDTLVERLKDPKTYDNITKDFKYSL